MEKCIICGSDEIIKTNAKIMPFVAHRMYDTDDKSTQLVHCPECSFLCSDKRPNDEQMAKYYQNYMVGEYIEERCKFEKNFKNSIKNYKKNGGKKKEFKARKSMMYNCFSKFIDFNNIKTVLDWGGARGEYIIDSFKDAEKYVYDIDNTEPIKGVKKVSRDDIKNHKWDFIMCCHVLEHVPYPIDVINEMIENMSEGTYLYIEVPYETYVSSAAYENKTCEIHEHINFFRRRTLKKIFDRPDFITLECNIVTDNSYFCQSVAVYILVQKVNPEQKKTLKIQTIEKNVEIAKKKAKSKKELSPYFKFKTNLREFDENVQKVMKELSGKKVVLCGADIGFETLNQKYNFIEKLNIIAIADEDFRQENPETLYGIKTIIPDDIAKEDFDYVLVTYEQYKSISYYLEDEVLNAGKIKTLFNERVNDECININYLSNLKFDKQLPKLVKKLENKKVVLYGTGVYLQAILTYFNLSELNIIGVSDRKYSKPGSEENFFGYKTYSPSDIKEVNPDYVIITARYIPLIMKDLKENLLKGTKIKVIPLVKKSFFNF